MLPESWMNSFACDASALVRMLPDVDFRGEVNLCVC